jgi:predicted enzyme related to lactoylglutathione lyase
MGRKRQHRGHLTDWEDVRMARLNHLTLFVRDRNTARDWYVRNLNLELEFEVAETATTAVRDPADFTIFLTERPSAEDAPRCVLYFQVDDIDAEYQRLQQSGAKVAHPPRKTLWGYGPEIIDPDGHVVRLWDQRSVT